MSTTVPALDLRSPRGRANGRSRVVEGKTNRVRRDGKFFRLGDEKFFVKGVTYGPFAPNSQGQYLPEPRQARRDLEQIVQLHANVLRVYHVPPPWFMDLAHELGLKIFVDISWPKNLTFDGDQRVIEAARGAVRDAARRCGNHPAIFALSVVNEIPADIVRFVGRRRVEEFIDELVATAKAEAPDCLVTFANYPTTEYVQPRQIDFVCFNVYLEEERVLRNYLARLQNIAGERPLMLGEYGLDTMQRCTEAQQAEGLCGHIRAVFDEGLVGTCIFSFTDDWYTGGRQIEDWAFGLVRRDRTPKPAFQAVQRAFERVPQLAEEKLPKVSVVVCSYNGGSTLEGCLRSLEKLHYPDYEVIVVDDGSTDDTQEILSRFAWVRNIRQKNMGLSHARNEGARAATGEIVAYTDSDCEADPDWLYYLVLTLIRSPHVGVGGPNLIPDEGSWIADAVGLSPGGPTHVMLDDRTAEHVPGCNMAFYRWAVLKTLFDEQFRKAGDDVDFIWRLQHAGYTIGFSPAAQVWHYRRNTIDAYLRQQRGYGEAEALLKYKHPDRFNALGASFWRGRLYGTDGIGIRVGGDVVYHGVFGTALFQTIYHRPASVLAAMLMSVEWHLLTGFVLILALAWPALLNLAAVMFLTPIALAIVAAIQAPAPRHRHWLSRPLVAYLHWRQPITRGWARYAVRLKAKVMKHETGGYRRGRPLPFDPADERTLRYWSKQHDRVDLLREIIREASAQGWRMRQDSGWAGWDLEIFASRYVKVRISTATEQHAEGNRLTRVRVETLMSKFCLVLLGAGLLLSLMLMVFGNLWPHNRPAVLIPLMVWAMYVVNRRMVTPPVLGLIDTVAERCGFAPVPSVNLRLPDETATAHGPGTADGAGRGDQEIGCACGGRG